MRGIQSDSALIPTVSYRHPKNAKVQPKMSFLGRFTSDPSALTSVCPAGVAQTSMHSLCRQAVPTNMPLVRPSLDTFGCDPSATPVVPRATDFRTSDHDAFAHEMTSGLAALTIDADGSTNSHRTEGGSRKVQVMIKDGSWHTLDLRRPGTPNQVLKALTLALKESGLTIDDIAQIEHASDADEKWWTSLFPPTAYTQVQDDISRVKGKDDEKAGRHSAPRRKRPTDLTTVLPTLVLGMAIYACLRGKRGGPRLPRRRRPNMVNRRNIARNNARLPFIISSTPTADRERTKSSDRPGQRAV